MDAWRKKPYIREEDMHFELSAGGQHMMLLILSRFQGQKRESGIGGLFITLTSQEEILMSERW